MTVYACADNNMGVAFNGRRQSRDGAVVEKIWEMSGGRVIMSSYSARLFAQYGVKAAEGCMDTAGDDCHYFSELENLKRYGDRISRLVIFRWNRNYPYDVVLGVELDKFSLIEREEISGRSHPKIDCEVWEK